MTGISLGFLGGGSGQRFRYARAEPEQLRDALALLLTGEHRGHDAAVDQFVQFAGQQKMNLEECWVAWREDQPLATALLIPSAGRSAVLFMSPQRKRKLLSVAGALVSAVCAAQDPTRIKLIQALLDPGQKLEAESLQEAGFRHLAELVYMERAGTSPVRKLDLGADIEVQTWREELAPQFARAIAHSYEGTLDCPGLLGVRDIDDVMVGHRATGVFQPALWHLLHSGSEPVGVMLLSQLPPRRALELVYLGLCPAWRSKGIGRSLMEYALGLPARHDAEHIVLAVDRGNTPAVNLYRKLGFASTDRKVAMILALK